jgi:hypothetical protein
VQRLIAFLLLLLAGCATAPAQAPDDRAMPALRLAPAALGRELALQQRLSFEHGDRRDSVDALVEVDATSLRLVMHAQGQVALRLTWDGATLDQQRADWLPPALSAERVLDDLQLVYWPPQAINASLPAGWQLREHAGRRELMHRDEVVVTVNYPDPSRARLQQHRQDYLLDIQSAPVTP